MAENLSSGHDKTTKKDLVVINKSAILARELGFVRNPQEKPTTWYRTFEKPISTIPLLKNGTTENLIGYATLAFADVGKFEPNKGENIVIGVRIGADTSFWSKDFTKVYDHMLLPKGPLGSLDKKGLKQGGYQKLAPLLRDIEVSGFYQSALNVMAEKMQYGQRLIETMIVPVVAEHFPTYQEFFDQYTTLGVIYFYKIGQGLRVAVTPNSFSIEQGKVRLTTSGKIDIEYFQRSAVIISPPLDSLPKGRAYSNWPYIERDKDNAKIVFDQALKEVRHK